MLHGWMDVGASFQFVVDALAAADGFDRWVVAPDWRGFGADRAPRRRQLLVSRLPGRPRRAARRGARRGALDRRDRPRRPQHGRQRRDELRRHPPAAHSPARQPRRLRHARPQPRQAPERLAQWLDELKTPQTLRSYDSVAEVAERLLKNDPLLTPDKAAWLAPHWSRQDSRATVTAAGTSWATRRTSASTRCCTASDEVIATWTAHRRAGAVGRGRPHRDAASGGATAIRAATSKRGWRVVPQRRTRAARALRPHAAPRPARGAGSGIWRAS